MDTIVAAVLVRVRAGERLLDACLAEGLDAATPLHAAVARDVTAALLAEKSKRVWPRARKRARSKAARIYVFGCVAPVEWGGEVFAVKVGFTRADVLTRLGGVQTGCPLEVRLLTWAYASLATERALHEGLRLSAMRGEWFRCDATTRALVTNIQPGSTLQLEDVDGLLGACGPAVPIRLVGGS